ncbi:MAG TPA: hypothetical protein VHN77_14300 [Phycisphaerales bacterium]|nr:hypothetical protein [Phycisphaerales bacterium]
MKRITLALALATAGAAHAQTYTVDESSRHCWSPNAGWIDAGATPFTDGLRLEPAFASGWAWSPNVGWIGFGDGNGPYANTAASNYGVNIDGAGQLSGFAWSPNTGWLDLGAGAPFGQAAVVDAAAQRLRGFAWSPNLGWVSLDLQAPGQFIALVPQGCDSIDFNRDSLFPDTSDIDDFLTVFAGGSCSTGTCADIDFNNDGLFPDTLDIDSFLSVFSGGPCL